MRETDWHLNPDEHDKDRYSSRLLLGADGAEGASGAIRDGQNSSGSF